MALNTAAMDAAGTAIQALLAYGQLHTSAAGSSGTSNLTTAGRQPAVWSAPTTLGTFGLATPMTFTGGAASGPVYSVTLWSASSGGAFYGEFPLLGDNAFTPSGGYSVTALNFTGSAS